jgi:hypothetical protein
MTHICWWRQEEVDEKYDICPNCMAPRSYKEWQSNFNPRQAAIPAPSMAGSEGASAAGCGNTSTEAPYKNTLAVFALLFLCSCAAQNAAQTRQFHALFETQPCSCDCRVISSGAPRFMPMDSRHLAESLELMQLEQRRMP